MTNNISKLIVRADGKNPQKMKAVFIRQVNQPQGSAKYKDNRKKSATVLEHATIVNHKIDTSDIYRKSTKLIESIIVNHRINICIDKNKIVYFADNDNLEYVARFYVKCTTSNGGTYSTNIPYNYTEKDINRLIDKLVSKFYGVRSCMLDNIVNMLSSTIDSIGYKTLRVLSLSAIKHILPLLKLDSRRYMCDIITLYLLHGEDCVKVCRKLKGFHILCLHVAHGVDDIADLWESFILSYGRQNSRKLKGVHETNENGDKVEVEASKVDVNEAISKEYLTAKIDSRIDDLCNYLYYGGEAERFAYALLDSSKNGTANRRQLQKKAEKLQVAFNLQNKISVRDFKALCLLAIQQHSIA